MRSRGEHGQVALEYLGVLFVVAAIVTGLLLAGLGPKMADAIGGVVCTLTGGSDCGAGGGGEPGGAQALADRAAAIGPFTDSQGGILPGLLDEARAAVAAGDADRAGTLLDRLELYRTLSAGGRGELVDALHGTAADFRALVDRGTIGMGSTNRRYFDVPPSPGDGVIVLDYFIPFDQSAGLHGDDRGVVDPILGDLELEQSRVTVVIDRESGRAMITQTETCTGGVVAAAVDFCQAPRPIALGPRDYELQLKPGDANEFDLRFEGGSFNVAYDALNSITPIGLSVDGDVTFTRGGDGLYEVTEEHRNDYPTIVAYQYRPGRPPAQIDRRDSEPIGRGAGGILGDVGCDVSRWTPSVAAQLAHAVMC